MRKHWLASVAFFVAFAFVAEASAAEKKYDSGVSDAEIKIGQTMPYSGPVSVYGQIGRAQLAYFAKINAEGGINGRKIKLISLDDGYLPPKAPEQVRRLVEEDKVFLVFNSVGTATNVIVRGYLNANRVPHLFVAGGDAAWGDYQHYPWTFG
jgi:branched-chain amino acid transport system substrate-binding protein